MLSIQKVKELLKDQHIDDKQAELIRDSFYSLAELIFEKWQEDEQRNQPIYPQNYTLFESKNKV